METLKQAEQETCTKVEVLLEIPNDEFSPQYNEEFCHCNTVN